MLYLFFVSLLLAASSDDASGDTFLIQNCLLEKVSYTHSYVVCKFCITTAGSINKIVSSKKVSYTHFYVVCLFHIIIAGSING